MKNILRAAIVLVVVLVMVAAVAKRKAALKKVPPYGVRPVAVHVAPVVQEPLESTHSYLGVVEPWQVARISSRLSARVDAVSRREGDSVKAGDLLLQLDDKDVQAQIKVVDAQIAALESTFQSLETNKKFWEEEDQRDSKLAEEGVISSVAAATTHNRMAEAVSKYLSAQGNLETFRSNRVSLMTKLAYTQLTSPFDGQVTIRTVDPGDLAAPGQSLMVVEDRSALKITFDAPQEDMEFLKEGLPVRAEVAGEPMDWEITRIYPSLDRMRMVRVEVKARSVPELQSGSFLPLDVVVQKHENAITIPRESLMQRASNDWMVFTVADKKLHLRSVKKVMESGGRVEVLGLEPGEQVVTSTFLGWANLAEGLKVEVVK